MTKLPESYPNEVIGEPSEPPSVRFCSTCETNVVPVGLGQCPKCGQFLLLNIAHKHTVNVKRRDHYYAENVATYRPDTLHLRRACRLLANIDERLDNTREGTPEHQRLIDAWTELTATLEASRQARESSMDERLASLTHDQVIEKLERVQKMLELLRDSKSGLAPGFELIGSSATASGALPSDDNDGSGLPSLPESGPLGSTPTTSDVFPAGIKNPETCPYCHQTPCVGRSHHSYDVLHYEDPEHVEQRRQRATAEMHESLRRYGPYRY